MAEENQEESSESQQEADENEQTGEETPQGISARGGTMAFASPEGIIMMSIAIGLDLAGLVDAIPVIGNILSYVVDFLGITIIGGWMYFRSGTMQATGRAGARIGKAAKWAKRLKWLRPLLIVGELIPVVGALPLWTLLVAFELMAS